MQRVSRSESSKEIDQQTAGSPAMRSASLRAVYAFGGAKAVERELLDGTPFTPAGEGEA
jgi:hypothetical protein